MPPLTGGGKARKDPAPSRLSYKMKRLWRRAAFRRAVTVHGPIVIAVASIGWAAAQPQIRADVVELTAMVRSAVSERPEFAVRRIDVRGNNLTPEVAQEVRASLSPWLGASSLAADAAEIRAAVGQIGWVESAGVRLSAPETLIVTVRERRPVAIWRRGEALTLLGAAGEHIAPLAARAERPNLPLIAGDGADRAVADALAVIAAAAGVGPRLRGLVRVGERRWNAVIQDGPLVMLPALRAPDAMGYLAALDAGENVLSRDVTHVDLRLADRPTLRLSAEAMEALQAARKPRKPGKDA
ncbi:MAG: cell division protein FtsQ/DivIB [Paracoccaceae bacterium]